VVSEFPPVAGRDPSDGKDSFVMYGAFDVADGKRVFEELIQTNWFWLKW
jgi:hypothetical protein